MKKRARHGYTLMEVMVSLAVLAVGAMGIVALQKVAGVGNTNARNVAAANRVAAKWAERLELDGRSWSDISGFGGTYWLKGATDLPGQWISPAVKPLYASPEADVLGADLFDNDPAETAFCTLLRLTKFPGYSGALRAEVRVFWSKAGDPADCALTAADVDAAPGRYGSVHTLLTVVASR